MNKGKIFSNINSFTHSLVSSVVEPGDIVVDATAGNGNDTLFLARLVEKGKVFAFDIQKVAIEKTKKLLENNNVFERVVLLNCGHEKMESQVPNGVKVVMFNLGYLPNSDHRVITLPETTLKGITQAMNLLTSGGIITITVYTGHQGGLLEKEAVEELVCRLDKKKWDVLKWSFLNRSETAPYLIVLYKREGVTINEK